MLPTGFTALVGKLLFPMFLLGLFRCVCIVAAVIQDLFSFLSSLSNADASPVAQLQAVYLG